MNGLDPIAAVGAEATLAQVSPRASQAAEAPGFSELLGQALQHVESKIETANTLVRSFALDDSVPIHQVTVALEEARLAVELALQVRTRLVEGYREIMNMQL